MPKRRKDRLLGATRPLGTEEITMFVPELDIEGRAIGQAGWVRAFLDLFGRLFGGATAFPRGQGVWRDDRHGGRLVFEKTVMVMSFSSRGDFDRGAPLLRAFLHHFGRHARQGEVGIVISGVYRGISSFDEEKGA